MGSVFRRKVKFTVKDGRTVKKRTATFFARFNSGGKDFCISTGKTTKPEAEVELARLMGIHRGETDIDEYFEDLLGLLARLPDPERDRKRQQFARRLMAGQQEKLPLANGWKSWLASPNKKRTPKPATLAGYESIWNRFQAWAAGQGIEHLHEVAGKMANDYAKDLWESKISPATFNAHVKFLTGAFALLERDAGLTENVWRKIVRKERIKDHGRRHLSLEELRTVLQRAQGHLREIAVCFRVEGLEARVHRREQFLQLHERADDVAFNFGKWFGCTGGRVIAELDRQLLQFGDCFLRLQILEQERERAGCGCG